MITQADILIVDDQPANLQVLAAILKKYGYHVRPAITGDLALKAAFKSPPDLILLDVRMPDMDGYEICQQLKAEAQTRDIPVIFISALDQAEDKVKAFASGGVDYVTKPFNVREVLARVQIHLSLRGMQKQLADKNEQLEQEIGERMRAEAALQKRSRELELLNRAAQAFGSTLDLDELLIHVLEQVRDMLGVAACSIWLFDPQTGDLVCRQSAGPGSEMMCGWRLEPGQGVADWVARHAQSLIVEDTDAEQRHMRDVELQTGLGARSLIGVPLRVPERVIGVLELVSTEVHAFDIDALAVLEPLAVEAAVAIDNANLFEQAQNEIAERRRAEQLLRESENRYRSLVENSQSGIMVVDDNYRIVYVNDRLCQILVYERPELIGLDFRELIPEPQNRFVIDRYLRRRGGETPPAIYEFDVHRGDGRQRCIEIRVYLTQDVDGRTQTVAQLIDVTERKRAEKAMIQASRLEATATLSSGIAHKVNNLMVGVLGYAELLKGDMEDKPESMEMLDVISRSAEQAGELAIQLLSFAANASYQPRRVNLNEIIHRVLQMQERSLPAGVQIQVHTDPELWPLEADPMQVSQVFFNLLTNAVEAIEAEGCVNVSTSNVMVDERQTELLPGPHVCLSVQDTGVGMSSEAQARVFEPFFTTKVEGRGLGLAAAYGIIKRHGGDITLQSEEGQGSHFTVYLPACPEG